MGIQVFGEGAVQTAYVSYVPLDITANSITLVWPSSYVNAPYIDPLTDIHYELFAAYMNVTTGALNVHTVTLPDAREVSVGQNFIIRNTGLTDFSLLKADGSLLQVVETGKAYYGILRDTSTQGGTWLVDTFAAGISQASAAALAGNGLVAIVDKLNTDIPVIVTNVAPVINTTYRAKLISWTGGTSDIFLPLISSVPAGFYFSLTNQGAGILTVKPLEVVNPPTIGGQTNIEVLLKQSLTFISDGTNWQTLGFGQNQFAVDTVNSLNVTSRPSPLTLTSQEASSVIQNFFGTLTANVIVYFPISVNNWFVHNSTTGNFTLTIQLVNGVGTPIGTPFILPQGSQQVFYSDGNSLYRSPTALSLINGTESSPALSFSNNLTTGFYLSSGGNDLNTTVNGQRTALFGNSATQGSIVAVSPNGSIVQITSDNTVGALAIAPPPFGAPAVAFMTINPTTQVVTILQPLTLSSGLSSPLPLTSGGTGATTQLQAAINILPAALLAGTTIYYNGTDWVILAPPAIGGAATAYLKITKATGVPFWSDT